MYARAGENAAPGGVRARETLVELEALRVRLWQTAELERYVDREALLRDEATHEPPYWMHLWPGAMAAARLVARAGALTPGTRVLELGCGLGLPAIAAAARGARVVASDWHREPLGFVRRSALLNHCRVDLVQMDWATPALHGSFDLCLGADVAYDGGAEPALVAALSRLLAPTGQAWLADSVNTARPTLVERLRAAGFCVAVRQVREWEEQRLVWVRVIEARR